MAAINLLSNLGCKLLPLGDRTLKGYMARRAKDELNLLDLHPSKGRGQNFLINPEVIDQILNFGAPQSSENLLEIGPGLGALTEVLQKMGSLKVIEIEGKFCDHLKKLYPEIHVLNADVTKVDLSTLGEDLVIFGNLPYSRSTDIVFHLVRYGANIKRAVLMLQREFAERLAAPPGGRDYGVLTVTTRLWCDARLGPIIGGDSFHPPTKVSSRLVELTFLKAPRVAGLDPGRFEKVVKAAFFRRRRKLFNSIVSSGIEKREKIEEILKALKIDGNRRAETLTFEEYVQLTDALLPASGHDK